MGNGYTIKCRKCSYEYQAMLGFGMLFPTVYENTVKAIREGKLGEDYRKFFEEHKDAAVNCEACAAVCTGCGKFATVPDYGLYLPKKETGGTGFGCVLAEDLKKDYRQVMKYDHIYHWNENEFGSMLSFAFNIGSIDSLTDYGKRSKKEISEKILLYNKAGGRFLRGLTRRRIAERKLFLTPVEKEEKKPMEKENIVYFKKYTGKHDGIVKILDAKKYDSSFESRARIAKLNGISNYTGTAEQNTKMVKLIKAGKLIKKKLK